MTAGAAGAEVTDRQPATNGLEAAGDAGEEALAGMRGAIRAAVEAERPLRLRGGDTKVFLGRPVVAAPLDLRPYAGVVTYEPAELVITARAGTLLSELEATLAQRGQMLGFEPPRFGAGSTLGGVVAAGLSGPARPYLGAVRDFVLGVRIMDHTGTLLRFGGQVMKNVAGYDVSRLMAGALGTLGPITEVSLRVVPRPAQTCSIAWRLDETAATARMQSLGRLALPISGLQYDGEMLHARLAGTAEALAAAVDTLRPEAVTNDLSVWDGLRDLSLPFFAGPGRLWRLIVPPATPPLAVPGHWYWDWGGAQRWLRSSAAPGHIIAQAAAAGGHASLFRGADGSEPPSALAPALLGLVQRIKRSFDPHGLFNPGRLHPEL